MKPQYFDGRLVIDTVPTVSGVYVATRGTSLIAEPYYQFVSIEEVRALHTVLGKILERAGQ